ncbi:MAG: prevent-host-death protein [Coxiella sp. RIFCSPHIGHO2_12_FULL_44_14]|nr:MAG: prevent-host-death protein [Coxiella sp. RIFCSPHIGHO2_12_FULL_44_14]
MKTWQLQTAKARFSEVVKNATEQGPQEITLRGKSAVVVISKREYTRLIQPKPTFVKFIRHSPLAKIKVRLARDTSLTRDIDL